MTKNRLVSIDNIKMLSIDMGGLMSIRTRSLPTVLPPAPPPPSRGGAWVASPPSRRRRPRAISPPRLDDDGPDGVHRPRARVPPRRPRVFRRSPPPREFASPEHLSPSQPPDDDGPDGVHRSRARVPPHRPRLVFTDASTRPPFHGTPSLDPVVVSPAAADRSCSR